MLLVPMLGSDNPAFLFYALVGFAGAVMIYLWVDNPRSSEGLVVERFDLKAMLRVVTDRATLVVLAGIALYGAGYGLAVTIIPAFLISAKGFGQAAISLCFSLFYIAISLAQLLAGPFSDKKGRQGLMVGGLVLAAGGLAWFSPLQPPWIQVSLTLASLGLGVFCVASLAFLNERVSDSLKGTISGAYYLFWGVGYFLGPLAVGALDHGLGLSAGFYLLAGLLGLEGILLLVVGAKG
jgi:MFS family permease